MPTDPARYRGKKVKAFPYDENGRGSSMLVLPIVDGSEITGYLPAKAQDNGDGTATLAVLATVSIDPGDVSIGAVEIKDGDSDTRADVENDGTHNALTVRANSWPLPTGAATETTLAAILAALQIYVVGETPAGAVDGVNDTFTTAEQYKPGTTHLYLNGIRQKEGVGFDYAEQGDNTTIIFEPGNIPQVGDTLLIDYIKL